jgi:hypothetical protein
VAQTHRPPLSAARTFATTVSDKFSLEPPVDILQFVARFADVEHDDIPGGCDGLLVRRRVRSLVILAAPQKGALRERFTAAHELGHLLLPWQTDSTVCDMAPGEWQLDDLATAIEMDANHFASELLLPTRWLLNRVAAAAADEVAAAVALAGELAQVSVPVTVLAAARCIAGPGFIASTNEEGLVQQVAQLGDSSGPRARIPKAGEVLVPARYESTAAQITTDRFRGRRLWVVQHPQEAEITLAPVESSGAMLAEMLGELDPAEALKMKRAISGVIGLLNGSPAGREASTAGALYAALRPRFVHRPELAPAVNHPRFQEFLQARAVELINKRK